MTASDSISIRPVQAPDEPLREGLASLLIDTVEGGASVGFLVPLERAQAAGYWRRVFEGLGPELLLWVAECAGRVVGSVQLAPSPRPNGRHRAEVQKLLVHRQWRARGISSRLLGTLEAEARRLDRTLLVLDTESGSHAETVYAHLGWQRAGGVPGYALNTTGPPTPNVYYFKTL